VNRGHIGPLGTFLALAGAGGLAGVGGMIRLEQEREELLVRARRLGVKQPEIHSSHDLHAEIDVLMRGRPVTPGQMLDLGALCGGARGGGKTQRFDEMVPMPPKKTHARSKAERKARRAKRKQRRQR